VDRTECGGGGPAAIAAAESSTTTVKTVISGPAASADPLATDTEAANVINSFEGVELDHEAQAEIYRALEACAERRRALADDPESDPERIYVGEAETNAWLGELESGIEGDWVEYRPEGEHLWENLGEGGGAAEIDEAVAGIAARRAAMTPEERAAEAEADRAAIEAQRARQNVLPGPEPDPDDPRLDWRNWGETGYTPPTLDTVRPEPVEGLPSDPLPPLTVHPEPVEGRTHKPRKPYKKRQPKPPFTPPDEERKARAVAEVEAERREAAAAETERRKRRAHRDTGRRRDNDAAS
jgi:hypothetical protein